MSKKNRMRDCPAAGRAIEAFECAEGCHTTYACPEHCPFNPFSANNYENYGKIEGGADTKFFNWLVKYSPNPSEFETRISRALGDRPDSQFFHTLAWHSVYLRNPDGNTCLEKWARQDFPGTSKDERLVLRAKMDMRPTIIEVQRILDDKRLQVVDLLDPSKTPFIMVDRVLAKHAVRFGVYAVHAFPLPHFSRLFGTSYVIPSMPPFEPEEIITEIIRHLGGGTDEQGKRRWLMEYYTLFEEALLAVGLARRKAMFDNLDAQFGKAVYEVLAPFEECRDRLRAVEQVEEDPLALSEEAEGFVEGRVWFAKSDDPEYDIVGEGAALGRILLGKTHWRIDCMGGSRLDTLRNRFESLMEGRVRFVGERRDDIAAQLRLEEPSYDPALVPPALLGHPQELSTAVARVPVPEESWPEEEIMADYLIKRDVEWLATPVPAFKGRTPREAALDPNLRPELIRLMKERIRDCDTRNLETGSNDDISWMLRDLGLNEILFDPPPPRDRVKLISTSPEDEGEEYYDEPEFLTLPPPPALPDGAWTKGEASARFEQALAAFPKITQAFDYLIEMDYPLFQDLGEIAGDLLGDREKQFLAPILSLLVLAFAPRGTCPPEIEFADLSEAFRREMTAFDNPSSNRFEDQFVEWLKRSSQPQLLEVYLSLAVTLSEQAPPNLQPGNASRTSFFIIIRVVIDELDRAMRKGY